MQLRSGFSLIEVLIAVMILATGLTGLFRSLTMCMRMVELAKDRQAVMYVFSLGEITYPMRDVQDVEEDIPVDPDYSLVEGFCFERTVDEKEDPEDGVTDDGLYVVRTRVSWANGSEQEEVVRYVRQADSTTQK